MSDAPITIDYGDRGVVTIVADALALSHYVAELTSTAANRAIAARGMAHLVLSGGSTPLQVAELLMKPPYRDLPFWGQSHFYWGDERWVPMESLHSNAGVALRTLFNHVDVPPDHIHPMPTEGMEPAVAASEYARLIADLVPVEHDLPAFDLIFLGMGADGHTASLFPQSPALDCLNQLVTDNIVDAIDAIRLTMTSPLLSAGRQVVFMVAGESKAARLAQVLDGPFLPRALPAQSIQPAEGRLSWVIDRAAATKLARWPGATA